MDFYRKPAAAIGSTELKKAIERNRLRRLRKKETSSPALQGGGGRLPPQSRGEGFSENSYRPSTLSRLQNLGGTRPSLPTQNPPNSSPSLHPSNPSNSLASRLQRTEAFPQGAASKTSNAFFSPPQEKPKNKWYQKALITCGWLLCFILLVRLIFADRGMIHYYSQENFIRQKIHQNQLTRKDNLALAKEIKKITRDPVHQRKLARQHLGMIAKDEYLIVFPKENPSL